MLFDETPMKPEQYNLFTPIGLWREEIRKIAKQYDVELPNFFENEFTISVINQYRERGSLTAKQVQALVNCSIGISEYQGNRGGAYYDHGIGAQWNNGWNNGLDCDEGYWDDLGSMGYLN